MKVLKLSLKAGIASLLVNSLDDLWHLSKIIEKGDLASAVTTRKIKFGGEAERQKAEKKTVYIKIEVDKVELGHDLKLHGRTAVESGDIAKGSAHSLDVSLGTELTIEKARWMNYQIERLREAEKASAAPKALVCVLDDEEATFAYLTAAGLKTAGRLSLRLSKKRVLEKGEKEKSIAEIIDLIKEKGAVADYIILGSPLIWKEVVLKELKSKLPDIAKRVLLENVSTGSKRGLHELLAQGTLNKIIKESRLAKEIQLIDRLLAEIARGRKAIYGIDAVQTNAISILLVTDKFLETYKEEVINIIDVVEFQKGEVHIIDSKNEAGRKLDSLGGIGGLKRY